MDGFIQSDQVEMPMKLAIAYAIYLPVLFLPWFFYCFLELFHSDTVDVGNIYLPAVRFVDWRNMTAMS